MRTPSFVVSVLAALFVAGPVFADDTLRIAVGQRGLWDTSVPELGQRGGIFKKHGIVLDILYTQGGGETQQAVISGSVELGSSAGSLGVFGAYSKGAPVRIIGAEMTGGADLYWYVRADSPVKRLQDIDGRTIAYSTNGASTHAIVTALIKQYDLKARPVATGSPAATVTQVMSGQIDVGWAGPPFGLDLMEQGKIRIIANGNDATAFRNQTVRLLITNTATLQARADAIARFMRAYRETVDWMYADPVAFRHYTEFMGIPEATMRRAREEFYPKAALDPDAIVGTDAINADAVVFKYAAAPLTREQLAELIRIPPR
jgi:ABC-type nitrate/sulfonate/bicarbonate transport system substrate-binding protein